LSTKSKTSISWTVNKVSKSYENLTSDQKIEKYEKLQTQLEKILEKVETSSQYSDTKKALYEDIINELLNQLDDKIDELN
jgi:predicted NACHT family NTPase